jgi:hypothetical protein
VVLVWGLDFVKYDKEYSIIFSRTYVDGELFNPEIDVKDPANSHEVLANFLTLFPKKDIESIKLDSNENILYNIIEFYKEFKALGFVGIFSIAEYDTQQPFIWKKAYNVRDIVFEKFYEMFPNFFMNTGFEESDRTKPYFDWLDGIIKDLYYEWSISKDKFYSKHETLSLNETNSSIDIDNAIGNQIKITKNLNDTEKTSSKVSSSWEIQLINTYGNPVTPISRFQDGYYFAPIEDDIFYQGIEAMSFSVLKNIVDMRSMNLNHIKECLPDNSGYEYIIFETIENKGLLLIMYVINYDLQTKMGLEIPMDDELKVLRKMAEEISQKDWFDDGKLKDKKNTEDLIEIYRKHYMEFFNNSN